ncbi:EAL domain-containing protein [Granulosicoccaceae sp. 1_MG-2023]|nr:EAL domain-containing protein [Granulosicoccaceae sp. 1_MG-2023]
MPGPHKRTSALVLIADDDPSQRILLRAALEGGGFSVAEACDGRQALQLFSEQKPDLLLLDVSMPDMDGYSVCEEIRSKRGIRDVPIVMVTGLDDIDSIDRAYRIGATDFMTKPVTLATLCHRVRYLLKSSRAMSELSESQASLAFAQQVARMGSFSLRLPDYQFSVSDEMARLFGVSDTRELSDLDTFLTLLGEANRQHMQHSLAKIKAEHSGFRTELSITTAAGVVKDVEVQAACVADEEGKLVQLHGIIHDITERRNAEQRIRQLAYFDPLTGLPNRQQFRQNTLELIESAQAGGHQFALLFVDLDNFKDINDTLGHSAGDILLQRVAESIARVLRSSDSTPNNTTQAPSLSRLGGDEFTILIPLEKDASVVDGITERIMSQLCRSVDVNGNSIMVSGSIGIAVYPYDGEEVDVLLKNADIAMYHAKHMGKNNFRYFDWDMNHRILARVRMESDLRTAITKQQFCLHYQPKIDLSDGRISGVEALLRWNKPGYGPISPMDFIPVAEESGLIVEIGNWVMREACRQLHEWNQQGLRDIAISINLSPAQFRDKQLLLRVGEALNQFDLDYAMIEFEITESAVVENVSEAIGIMLAIKKLGITLSIDDFGTGYSSMEHLKKFPVDVLKIDRSFVQDIVDVKSDGAIIEAIIALSTALQLTSIAEGVETPEQVEFLRTAGCKQVQGYYYSRPLPAAQMSVLLSEWEDGKHTAPNHRQGRIGELKAAALKRFER